MFKKFLFVVAVVMISLSVVFTPISAKGNNPFDLTLTPDADYYCHDKNMDYAIGYINFEVSLPNADFPATVWVEKNGVPQTSFDIQYFGPSIDFLFEVAPDYDELGNILEKYTEYTFILEARGKTIIETVTIHSGPCE